MVGGGVPTTTDHAFERSIGFDLFLSDSGEAGIKGASGLFAISEGGKGGIGPSGGAGSEAFGWKDVEQVVARGKGTGKGDGGSIR